MSILTTFVSSTAPMMGHKGLNSENLVIIHAFASKGVGRTSHQAQGKISGKMRERKASHLEVIVREAS